MSQEYIQDMFKRFEAIQRTPTLTSPPNRVQPTIIEEPSTAYEFAKELESLFKSNESAVEIATSLISCRDRLISR